jgi:hypothetical protein
MSCIVWVSFVLVVALIDLGCGFYIPSNAILKSSGYSIRPHRQQQKYLIDSHSQQPRSSYSPLAPLGGIGIQSFTRCHAVPGIGTHATGEIVDVGGTTGRPIAYIKVPMRSQLKVYICRSLSILYARICRL